MKHSSTQAPRRFAKDPRPPAPRREPLARRAPRGSPSAGAASARPSRSRDGGKDGAAQPDPPLRRVDDSRPGYTRRRGADGFVYFNTRGLPIRDLREIARINALAIPPAYVDVWICVDPLGHLQATGRDDRGRKQYRYHPRWRELRDADKYARLGAFAQALPRIRARVSRDLSKPGLPREKIVAAVVRLLDSTLVRIGNAEYARDNASFGLTTLRKRHLSIEPGAMRLRFAGKSGVNHDVTIHDARVLPILHACAKLPGRQLFQYLDAEGARHAIGPVEINDYLRETGGADFSAKDYRTWAGSVNALALLRRAVWLDARQARKQIVATVREVAALLHNTPAVCRSSYIHPVVLEAFETGALAMLGPCTKRRGLRTDEILFASLLTGTTARA
ncbi:MULTISPECIES: DNA topoisomerase IB [Burkholderia]|uniref:DNA topoisomerase IB n=1 Tax=Burkholderia TaxID=32008 RepID=UPI00119B3F71|nr:MULTISPECIES: DNA topoisomerase IB [Burkholderia]MDN7735327.1 DNA topoisomerase IB [Burkholderia gladioli]TWC60382.1 DNA topoisomerase-1 [Burkholderia sp. SJZ089]TWC94835.1 DNA topoisomerase-1 [Burkholderia sp. SJZ115]TWC96931.1 DNA topoisomerase-1 [Burkholderia sp. SJZ091]